MKELFEVADVKSIAHYIGILRNLRTLPNCYVLLLDFFKNSSAVKKVWVTVSVLCKFCIFPAQIMMPHLANNAG